MKISDYELYKSLLKDKSGLELPPEKSYMLDSRLLPVAKKWGYPTLSAMTMTLYGVPETELVQDITEAMVNHETSFFRDYDVFKVLADFVLPYFKTHRKNAKSLRIWSAGCSSGQEPYSIAMKIMENDHLFSGKNVEIIATDLSNALLEKAETGTYDQFEIQRGLPAKMLLNYFESRGQKKWEIKKEIRRMVSFERQNLLENFDHLGDFDIIFCSHVLENFDKETKASILDRMTDHLPEDGFIIMAEEPDLDNLTDEIKPLKGCSGLYILSGGRYKFTDKAA